MGNLSKLVPKPLEDDSGRPCIQPPLLMLPDQEPNCKFYDISDVKYYELDLPEAYVNRFCGSSHGWLVMVEENPNVTLLNPITRSQIQLPPITTFPDVFEYRAEDVGREYHVLDFSDDVRLSSEYLKHRYMKKVALSGNPILDKDYVVMAVRRNGDLAFCREGDDRWTVLDTKSFEVFLHDVVYWNGIFYAIACCGELIACDLRGGHPTLEMIVNRFVPHNGKERYLVATLGKLYLVIRDQYGKYFSEEEFHEKKVAHAHGICLFRHYGYDENEDDEDWDDSEILFYRTLFFDVYELDQVRLKWKKVQSIGDHALFVGINVTT